MGPSARARGLPSTCWHRAFHKTAARFLRRAFLSGQWPSCSGGKVLKLGGSHTCCGRAQSSLPLWHSSCCFGTTLSASCSARSPPAVAKSGVSTWRAWRAFRTILFCCRTGQHQYMKGTSKCRNPINVLMQWTCSAYLKGKPVLTLDEAIALLLGEFVQSRVPAKYLTSALHKAEPLPERHDAARTSASSSFKALNRLKSRPPSSCLPPKKESVSLDVDSHFGTEAETRTRGKSGRSQSPALKERKKRASWA